jgi:hypothetical protein
MGSKCSGLLNKSIISSHYKFISPIKHISRKNQCILGGGLAKHLILLIAKFSNAAEARKIWCGKYLVYNKKVIDLYDNYDNKTW